MDHRVEGVGLVLCDASYGIMDGTSRPHLCFQFMNESGLESGLDVSWNASMLEEKVTFEETTLRLLDQPVVFEPVGEVATVLVVTAY